MLALRKIDQWLLAVVEFCCACAAGFICTGKSKCRANERDALTRKSFAFWLEVLLRTVQWNDMEIRKQMQ
jgi:hypothetical protein